VRTILSLAAALSLGLANTTYAQKKNQTAAPAVNVHQKLANEVAAHLGKSGHATGAKVMVTAQNGVVQIYGEVQSSRQAEALVQQAYSVPGVMKVETSFRLIATSDVAPAQAAEPIAPPPLPPTALHGNVNALTNDPIPLASPAMPAYDLSGPKMPPYAWPTYAPYPNFSRVGYPQAYPYNAFPYIGPFYPFPKVPLGWRSVKLEWDDGHWYLGRLSQPHDYWRVKFW